MSVNLSDKQMTPAISGAIVLGAHALFFARGDAQIDELPEKGRFDFSGFTCAYRQDSMTQQSFLEIDGQEIELSSLQDDELFELDFSAFMEGPRTRLRSDPGLMAIIAPTQWGKSTLLYGGILQALQDSYPVAVNYIEVYEDTYGVGYIYTARPLVLLKQILLAMLTPKSVIAIDSFRAFVYGKSQGGTGTAGLDQYFSIQLTALSNCFAAVGSLLIATINPLVKYDTEQDRKRYDEIVNQLVAGTTLAIAGTDQRRAEIYPRGLSQENRDKVDVMIRDIDSSKVAAAKVTAIASAKAPIVVANGKADETSLLQARRLLTAGVVNKEIKAKKGNV